MAVAVITAQPYSAAIQLSHTFGGGQSVVVSQWRSVGCTQGTRDVLFAQTGDRISVGKIRELLDVEAGATSHLSAANQNACVTANRALARCEK